MAKFELDTEFVRKLAQILHETNLGEIELGDGDKRIRVARPTDDGGGSARSRRRQPLLPRRRQQRAPPRQAATISASIPAR